MNGEITAANRPSNYFDLPDGEVARTPHPFPENMVCPKCGRTGGNVKTATYFRCWTCGHVGYQYGGDVVPMTAQLQAAPILEDSYTSCKRCGAPVVLKSRGNPRRGKYCDQCKKRVRADRERRRKANRAGTHQAMQPGHKAQISVARQNTSAKEVHNNFQPGAEMLVPGNSAPNLTTTERRI